jgi:hypothetical protein
MRSRFLLGVAAPALAALAFLSTAEPASAQYYGYRGFGWGAAGLAAGIVGGALAVATAPLWGPGYYGYNSYYPTYGYGPSAYGPSAYGQTLAYAPNYGYGYSPGYSYGPGYGYASNYGYGYGGYSPGYGYGGIYASAGRGVRVPARHPHHANYR